MTISTSEYLLFLMLPQEQGGACGRSGESLPIVEALHLFLRPLGPGLTCFHEPFVNSQHRPCLRSRAWLPEIIS